MTVGRETNTEVSRPDAGFLNLVVNKRELCERSCENSIHTKFSSERWNLPQNIEFFSTKLLPAEELLLAVVNITQNKSTQRRKLIYLVFHSVSTDETWV